MADKAGIGVWVVVMAGLTGTSMAQTGQPAQPAPAGAAPRTGPGAVPAQQLPIGLLMQRSGGSLARAEIADRPEGSVGITTSTSFISVPEPQPKLIHKHDIITIVVREDSNFSATGTTDLKHHSDIDALIDSYVQLHFPSMALKASTPATPFEIKATGDHDFKGSAKVDRTDTLTASVAATVIDVKPNGTLLIQATKSLKTDEEEQTLVLTGTCRVEDVTADNTILSTQIASLDLKKTHKGAIRDTTERGWIPRLLDTLNPF